jgi:hypothetical protein
MGINFRYNHHQSHFDSYLEPGKICVDGVLIQAVNPAEIAQTGIPPKFKKGRSKKSLNNI